MQKHPDNFCRWTDARFVHAVADSVSAGNDCARLGEWSLGRHPVSISMLFTYETYTRASVYEEFYVTSRVYKGQTKRDNTWIKFFHHVKPCAPPPPAVHCSCPIDIKHPSHLNGTDALQGGDPGQEGWTPR